MTNNTEIPSNIVKTNQVLGVKVENSQGHDLGKIEEIMLDKVNGKVCYVVLSFGGFLGLGDKFFAIPWSSFHYDNQKGVFILNVSKDKLEKAPGFDKSHWPQMTESWQQGIHQYYGTVFDQGKL